MQTQALFVPGMGEKVRVAHSLDGDTRAAMRSVLQELQAEDSALVYVFFSCRHDSQIVAEELQKSTGDRGIAGTTAGELSDAGFTETGITAISIPGNVARASVNIVTSLSEVSLVALSSIPQDLANRIGRSTDELSEERHVWMVLLDGLSGREELVTPFLARHCVNAPLVGGSLAGGRGFENVELVHDGKVYTDAAALVLLEYDRPFGLIHHTHHEFTDHWFEVTRVSSGGRIIEELDGRPALEVYGEALGYSADEVDTNLTGRHPLGFRFRGKPFPCSIMRCMENGFFMAYSVQRGERLALLESENMVEKSRQAITEAVSQIQERGGEPQALLLFHCLGRILESEVLGVKEELFEALHQAPICGLNTYGEQYQSMHMNHSITGLIFG